MGQPAHHRDEPPGGATTLGDATVVFLLLREAFRRIGGITSLAGMTIVTGLLVRGLYRITAPVLRKARPRRPSLASTTIGIAVLVEPLRGIAGDRARSSPWAGPVIAVSMLAPAVRRVAALTLIARAAFRTLRTALSLDPPRR